MGATVAHPISTIFALIVTTIPLFHVYHDISHLSAFKAAYFRNRRRLLNNWTHFVGFFILRICELIAATLGVIVSGFFRKKGM